MFCMCGVHKLHVCSGSRYANSHVLQEKSTVNAMQQKFSTFDIADHSVHTACIAKLGMLPGSAQTRTVRSLSHYAWLG